MKILGVVHDDTHHGLIQLSKYIRKNVKEGQVVGLEVPDRFELSKRYFNGSSKRIIKNYTESEGNKFFAKVIEEIHRKKAIAVPVESLELSKKENELRELVEYSDEYEPEVKRSQQYQIYRMGIERAVRMLEDTKKHQGNVLIVGAAHAAEFEHLAPNKTKPQYFLNQNELKQVNSHVKSYIGRLNENEMKDYARRIEFALKER